jgi:Transmembrane secretion effector
MATVEYWPREGRQNDLLTALEDNRFSRRHTGAAPGASGRMRPDPNRILEQFVVASWDEHLRQHERLTARDQDRLDKIRAMTDPAHPVTTPTGGRRNGTGLPRLARHRHSRG